MATQKKIDTVQDLTEKLSRAKSIVLADYRGLKHKQLEDLRKILKKVEADFTVTKNRLLLRALKSLPTFQGKPSLSDAVTPEESPNLNSYLSDTTAALFAYADEVAPLKELLKFFKAAGAGNPKGGLLGAQVLSGEEVTRLASLPNRNVLLGQLVGQLNAPIQGLHYALQWNINTFVWALNGVKEKKTN